MTMNVYSTCTKLVCHSYYQLLIINLSNIVLRVNIQTNKHFDVNEYFIARGINIQCLYAVIALGHIYTNNLPLALAPFAIVFKTHLLNMVV